MCQATDLSRSHSGATLPAVCDSKLIQLATSGRTSVPVRRRPSTPGHFMMKYSVYVLHPTKEGQFPLDPIFFGQTPVFLEGPWSGDSETVGEIEKGVRIFLREPFSQ